MLPTVGLNKLGGGGGWQPWSPRARLFAVNIVRASNDILWMNYIRNEQN